MRPQRLTFVIGEAFYPSNTKYQQLNDANSEHQNRDSYEVVVQPVAHGISLVTEQRYP